jgi:hypothetical protein
MLENLSLPGVIACGKAWKKHQYILDNLNHTKDTSKTIKLILKQ